jgi:class 3 adenylate cyclase
VPLAAGKDAERRPLTVMFCDLVDSTALASRLDAEDWRSLVNAALDEASAAATGLGGHVLKKLGDRLMALFGEGPPGELSFQARADPGRCL